MSGVADAVTSFVEAEKLRLRDLLTSYNPGELPKLEQAQVKVCGTYVFYSFLSEAETSAAITALEQTLRAVTRHLQATAAGRNATGGSFV